MSQQDNLDRMERGREAAMTESIIGPYLHNRINKIVEKMVSSYRSGKTEHDKLVGYAAQITAMYDLMADLEVTQRQGFIAAEREMSNGEEKEAN